MARFYTLISVIAFFDLLAIYAGKMAVVTGKSFYVAVCTLGFAFAGFFFALSLKYENVAIVNVLWTALSIVLVAIMGHYMFREHLSSLDVLGMAIIIIGLVLLNIK